MFDIESFNLTITILATFAALFSAISSWKSYQISKLLMKNCNIFFDTKRNSGNITATSQSERVLVQDITLKIKFGIFERKSFSLSKLLNVHLHDERTKGYDGLFSILFERGLTSGESYHFPLSRLFKIATNHIIAVAGERKNDLDLSKLKAGNIVDVVFNVNGRIEVIRIKLNNEIIDKINVLSKKDFRLQLKHS
ncbi:hypothetical protein [Photobacterium sanguinicancri]|uniref:hypothetical protein n=1 Tax=Photobacterium sanguinicancri TaxID=875932 RepID=UPI0026E39D48|nr:hypothetical protein [Photobacterium sanguinicancri]MDO6501177.1 hypothetical protein [Photobacterium sanguinicancri]